MGTSPERSLHWRDEYAVIFWEIAHKHAHTIGALLFGHKHLADYRVWGDGAAPHAPPLIAFGALSPVSHTSPIFYTLEVDEENMLSRVTPYHLSADKKGDRDEEKDGPPIFEPSPSLPEAFGEDTLVNDRFGRLADALESVHEDPTWRGYYDKVWDEVFADYYRGQTHGNIQDCNSAEDDVFKCRTCSGACRLSFCCLLSHGTTQAEYQAACVDPHLRVNKPPHL